MKSLGHELAGWLLYFAISVSFVVFMMGVVFLLVLLGVINFADWQPTPLEALALIAVGGIATWFLFKLIPRFME